MLARHVLVYSLARTRVELACFEEPVSKPGSLVICVVSGTVGTVPHQDNRESKGRGALAVDRVNLRERANPEEFGPAFSAVGRAHAQAMYVIEEAFFFTRRTTLHKLASTSKVRLPTSWGPRASADEGALMSYDRPSQAINALKSNQLHAGQHLVLHDVVRPKRRSHHRHPQRISSD